MVTGEVVLLISVPDIVDPLPLAVSPERPAGVFLIHEKVVPDTLFGLVMSICVKAVPEQTV